MARRLVNRRLQNALHMVSRKPRINICIRKDLFRNINQLNEITRLYEYTTYNCLNSNPYIYPVNIPFLMPKTCHCDMITDYNLTRCSCSPLESGIALHVETINESAKHPEIAVEAKDISSNQVSIIDKKNIVNVNIKTYVIVSDYLQRHGSTVGQLNLTFHDNITRRTTRTFGEVIGTANISVNNYALHDFVPFEYNVNVVQATDKELGIDAEWERIRKWAKNNGP